MARSKSLGKPTPSIPIPPLPVIAALLAVYLIWGSTYLGGAVALQSYPPFMLTAIRLLGSLVILLAALRLRRTARPTRREITHALITGALMFGGGAGLVALAQDLGVASGLASLGVAAVPIWATIFASFFGHRPQMLEGLGLLIGIAGIAILNLENGMQAQPLGAFVLLLGPMLWAFGSMLSNRLPLPAGLSGTFFQMIGGCIALLLLSALRGEQFPAAPSLLATASLVYLTVFGTLVAFSAYMYLVRTVRPALATSYAYVNPVIAVILGIALLAEPLTAVGILAMTVIVTGVVLVMFGRSR